MYVCVPVSVPRQRLSLQACVPKCTLVYVCVQRSFEFTRGGVPVHTRGCVCSVSVAAHAGVHAGVCTHVPASAFRSTRFLAELSQARVLLHGASSVALNTMLPDRAQ